MTGRASKSGGRRGGSRSAARLGAVQALYQLDATDTRLETVIGEFLEHRLGRDIDGDRYKDPDIEFFTDIVRGAMKTMEAIDRALTPALDANWPLKRLEAILKAMLRAAVYELLSRPDVPTSVVINEYVEVAHAFYAGSEPGFVNGVLDRIARTNRAPDDDIPDGQKP